MEDKIITYDKLYLKQNKYYSSKTNFIFRFEGTSKVKVTLDLMTFLKLLFLYVLCIDLCMFIAPLSYLAIVVDHVIFM
jgi:hypothetical protein